MKERIKVGFYAPTVAKYLADLYKPKQIIPEAVQNSLDSGAADMFIKVDAKNRMIWTLDNGRGAPHDEIKKKFEKIGLSFKTRDIDAIGQKGIGNIAGISISKRLTIVTIDRKNPKDKFRMYTLNADVPIDSEDLFLDCDDYPGGQLSIPGCPFKNVTTMARLEDVDPEALKEIHSIESIEEQLVNAYGTKLANKNIKIIWITAAGQEFEKNVENIRFRGAKLNPEGVSTNCGKVVFALYMSPAPLTDPRIFVTLRKGGFSVRVKDLLDAKQIDLATAEVLLSGYFEGNIFLRPDDETKEFCTLAANRTSFAYNNDLPVFKRTVSEYCANNLARYIKVLEDNAREDRLNKVSEHLKKELETLLKDHPEMEPKGFQVFDRRRTGTVDKPPVKRPTPKQIVNDIIEKKKKTPGKPYDGGQKKPEPKKYQPENGLNIVWYTPTAEEPQSWRSRTKDKLIQINLLHQDCMAADNRGQKSLVSYAIQLCFKEFTCSRLPASEASRFNDSFESLYMEYFRAMNN